MAGKTKVDSVLASLEQQATQHDFDNLARFGITASKAFGVSMANIQKLAKPLGRDHTLAAALWDTGWYEARLLTAFVDDPARVSSAQMDRWCADFDNWGICDTLCFHLFDRTPHAWAKIEKWSSKRDEFGKRARRANRRRAVPRWIGIDRASGPGRAQLRQEGPRLGAAADRRPQSFALRRVPRAVQAARGLARSRSRWVGKTTLRELEKPAARKRAKV